MQFGIIMQELRGVWWEEGPTGIATRTRYIVSSVYLSAYKILDWLYDMNP